MAYVLQNAHWFVLLIGALVFFHELGHFVVAKAFDVKVLKFSLGFGPKLIGFRRGETEYTLSLLPLGGYVKMVGEEPDEIEAQDEGRALSQKPLWQRSAIVIAGPLANLLLAFVVYLTMFVGPQTFGDTRLGIVTPGEPAYAAGIRPGDRIVEVDGEAVTRWDELQAAIAAHPDAPISMTYERGGVRTTVPVRTESRAEADAFEQMNRRGKAGLSLMYVQPVLAVVDPQSPAAKAGLSDGDRVLEVGGTPVAAWHEVRAQLVAQAMGGAPVKLLVQRGQERVAVALQPGPYPQGLGGAADERFSDANLLGPAGYTGLVSRNVLVAKVDPASPAARSGLTPGDRVRTLIVTRDGPEGRSVQRRPVGVWEVDLAAFGLDNTTELALEVQRGVSVATVAVRLQARDDTDEFKQVHHSFVLGAQNDGDSLGTYTYDAPVGPVLAVTQAAKQVGEDMGLIGRGIVKMVRGDIPLKNMGGPIMLFVIAEKSAKRGWQSFGRALAMTSVNLGMLNVLPVPVLDGGHLLFYAVEAVTRRPPSQRLREIGQMVGLGLLLLLMLLVFRNDIGRFLLSGS